MGDNRKTGELKEKMMLNIMKRLEDRIACSTPTKEPEEGGNEIVEKESEEAAVEAVEVEMVPRGLEQGPGREREGSAAGDTSTYAQSCFQSKN